MLRVLVKVATFVNGAVHKAGEEIVIAEHHFSEEIHELLEDLDPKPAAEPAAESTETEPPPAPAIAAEVVQPAATSAEASTTSTEEQKS